MPCSLLSISFQYLGQQPKARRKDLAEPCRTGALGVSAHIFSVWRHLTQSLTNNAAERFNRKVEKCLSGRYGFSSTTSVEVLLRGLWLKELVLNGRKHLAATSEFMALDWTEICQESLNVDNILHNFDEYALSRIEKLA